MSINGLSNNKLIKLYEQHEIKTYAQNNADNPIFKTESVSDTFQKATQSYQEDEIADTTSLKQDLEKTKSEQGIVSKAWDGIKNFFGAKTGSSNIEKTIEKFENGEISQEEARQALDEYKNAQNTFTDKLSGIISTAGLIGTVAGAILSFIPGGQVIGLPLLAISGKVALSGMFIDNALDLIDNSTDADGLTSNELKDLAIETGVEAVSYMAGRGIGKLTGNIHTNIAGKLLNNGASKVTSNIFGYASEAVVDGTLSLGADYAITQTQSLITTGKTVAWDDYWSWDRFTSEGRSQLIGILTGVATSKQYPSGAIAPAAVGTEVASKGVVADVQKIKSGETQMLSNINLNNNSNKVIFCMDNSNTKIDTSNPKTNDLAFLDIDANKISQETLNELYKILGLPFNKSDFNKNNDYKNQNIKTKIISDDMTIKTIYTYDESGTLVKKTQLSGLPRYDKDTEFSQGKTGDCALLSMVVGFLKNFQTRKQLIQAVTESPNGGYNVRIGSQTIEITQNELSNSNLSSIKKIRILELAYQKAGGNLDGEFAENVAKIFGLNPIHITSEKITDEILETISTNSNNFILSLGARVDASGTITPNGEFQHYFSIKNIDPKTKTLILVDTYDTSKTFTISFDDIKTQGVSIDGGSITKTDLPNIERNADETEFFGKKKTNNDPAQYKIRKCTTVKDYNDLKSHVEIPVLDYKNGKYSINGGHLINAYGTPDSNGVYRITLNGQNFELEPTEVPGVYKQYHISNGRQYRGIKGLATQTEINYILNKMHPNYTGSDFKPNNAGLFKCNGKYWRVFETISFYPITREEATTNNTGGKIPTL